MRKVSLRLVEGQTMLSVLLTPKSIHQTRKTQVDKLRKSHTAIRQFCPHSGIENWFSDFNSCLGTLPLRSKSLFSSNDEEVLCWHPAKTQSVSHRRPLQLVVKRPYCSINDQADVFQLSNIN